jgi:hypothetical protein
MIVTEFVTEIGNVKGKEIVNVSEDVAVPEKERENVIVVKEIEKGIEGKENAIEETGNGHGNVSHTLISLWFS